MLKKEEEEGGGEENPMITRSFIRTLSIISSHFIISITSL